MNARGAVFGLAVLVAASSAYADRDKAAASYKEAAAAFARGAFGEAAAAFEAAYAEDPRGASIYNAALSWQNAHDDPRAADDFARAVAAPDLKDDLLSNAKTQLAKLEASLAKLTIVGPAGAQFTVAHASGSVPFDVHLSPGHHVVHATYGVGAGADFPVDAVAGSSARVDLTPRVVASPVAPPPPPPPTRLGGVLGSGTLPIAVSLVGAGAIAGGFAIGLGVATLDALDQFNQSGRTSQSAHDQAVSLRTWTNVSLVAALVLGGAGIGALATVHRVRVHATIGLGSIVVGGEF